MGGRVPERGGENLEVPLVFIELCIESRTPSMEVMESPNITFTFVLFRWY